MNLLLPRVDGLLIPREAGVLVPLEEPDPVNLLVQLATGLCLLVTREKADLVNLRVRCQRKEEASLVYLLPSLAPGLRLLVPREEEVGLVYLLLLAAAEQALF